MKYANTIHDIPNALNIGPLSGDELDKYFIETMQTRTGDPHGSPILDILDGCRIPSERNSFLLMGHRGCGKSTELNKLTEYLTDEGFPVYTVQCAMELDPLNITHTDLLILMGEALLKLAEKQAVHLEDGLTEQIRRFWQSVEQKWIKEFGNGAESETGFGLGLQGLLRLFTSAKASIKYNDSYCVEYRETVERRTSEWIRLLRQVIDAITAATGGIQPVLIFEDLDKLESEAAWRVFSSYSNTLSGLPCPVIYTFPIALSYDTKFALLEGFFTIHTLPMIKIAYSDGKRCSEGFDIITKIVTARVDPNLFGERVLEHMIEKTGGALRDLFTVISAAARRADRRESATVELEDAQQALVQIKTNLTRRIDNEFYGFLAAICQGQRETIEDHEMLCKMLQAGTVLEYNGKRWHNVHPLVAEFLTDQRLIKNVNE